MSDIVSPIIFTDGVPNDVTAAKLLGHVNSAVIQPEFVSAKPAITPVGSDSIQFYQTLQDRLVRATITTILALVPANQPSGTASLRKLGAAATDAAAGNDLRFPSLLNGIRKANGPVLGVLQPDTVAGPQDFNAPATNVTGTVINFALNKKFYKVLAANAVMTFTNATDGDEIRFAVQNNGHTLTLPASTGDNPVPTPGKAFDIYTIEKIGGWTFMTVKSV